LAAVLVDFWADNTAAEGELVTGAR
jgi:hypothetical protein